jgi:hypothetical protein
MKLDACRLTDDYGFRDCNGSFQHVLVVGLSFLLARPCCIVISYAYFDRPGLFLLATIVLCLDEAGGFNPVW